MEGGGMLRECPGRNKGKDRDVGGCPTSVSFS